MRPPRASMSPGRPPIPCCGLRGKGNISWGEKEQHLVGGKVLNPGHPPALRQKPQHPSLSAVTSSPIPVPQPLITSPPPTAAARQLDELLADLGHMQSKVSLGPGGKEVGGLALTRPSSGPHHPPSWQLAAVGQGAGVPVEPKPSLDNMLGSLTRDLQELGITAAPASICATCRKPVAGKVSPPISSLVPLSPLLTASPGAGLTAPASLQVLTALGKTWHPEHFTCARCGQELGSRPFFERGGQAYCEEDYHQAFSPRCAYCAGPIREVSRPSLPCHPTPPPGASPCCFLQKVLTALDQTWHPEHFFCAHCGKVFGDDGTSQGMGVGAPVPIAPTPGIPPIAQPLHPSPHPVALPSFYCLPYLLSWASPMAMPHCKPPPRGVPILTPSPQVSTSGAGSRTATGTSWPCLPRNARAATAP